MHTNLHPALKSLVIDRNRKLHNITLLEADESGQFFIRCSGLGEEFEAKIFGSNSSGSGAQMLGKTGYLTFVISLKNQVDESHFVFHPYIEPTLRRVPAFDFVSKVGGVSVGWTCDARPDGFTVPPDIIPGVNGDWIAAKPTPVTIQVPHEFVQACEEVGQTSESVLRGFIADLCELQNYTANPREDGLSSNGSDERHLASEYFERAYSMFRETAMAAIQRLEESTARAEEEEFVASELMDLRQEFVDNGGSPDEFIKLVETLVKADGNHKA